MSRIIDAFTAEPWAIIPSELHKMAAILARHPGPEGKQETPDYVRRDYQLMAGPSAAKLPGAHRAFVIDGVAIIPVTGPIFPRANLMTEMSGATSISTLSNDFRAAIDNADVGAVILLMDTPGGAVSGVNAFADQVAAGAKRKTTVAYVSGYAASAGYWIAAAAGEIHLERTAMVGSIGVIAAVPKQKQPDAAGDLWIEIVSSGAPNKRPDPESEDGRSEIVTTLDAIEKQFVADVARGRGVTADRVLADFGQGGVKLGREAIAAGMADKMQSYETTLNTLRRAVANQRRLRALKQ
jgi:ClpP class serine protease